MSLGLLIAAYALPPLARVSTPFGAMEVRVASRLCRAERIFVGTIATAEPFVKRSGWFADGGSAASAMFSHVTFAVQRDVRGQGPFAWDLPGGRIGNTTASSPHGPEPRVGARYMLALRTFHYDHGEHQRGDWILSGWTPIPPDASIPSASELRDGVQAMCAALHCEPFCGDLRQPGPSL